MTIEATSEGAEAFIKQCFVRGLSEVEAARLLDRYIQESATINSPEED